MSDNLLLDTMAEVFGIEQDEDGNYIFGLEPMTNYDWLRTLSVEELIEWLKQPRSGRIVRCQDCKHWTDDRKDEADMGTCGLTHYFTNTDDFCSYGVQIDECEKEYRELGLYELRELRQVDERSRR